jgi:hypothetical protein
MNLQAKRAGQLLGVAVLFFLLSCEDDSFLLGFKGNSKFKGRIQEFVLPSTNLLIDSVVTQRSGRLLTGQFDDPTLGTVSSIAYTEYRTSVASFIDAAKAMKYDSVTIKMHMDLYYAGSQTANEEQIAVHEITEDTLTNLKTYYYNTSVGYSAGPIGQLSYKFNLDSLNKYSGGTIPARDYFIAQARLSDEFGSRLFNASLKSNDSLMYKITKFLAAFKGLALVPSSNTRIISFNPSSTTTAITLHYHTDNGVALPTDTLSRTFTFNPGGAISYNKIATARTGDLAAITEPYSGAPPSTTGKRYIQNGSPAITKLDLREYYDFIKGRAVGADTDSLEKIIINAAQLVIENVPPPPAGMAVPSTITLRVMKENDYFMNQTVEQDSIDMADFGLGLLRNLYYYAPIDDAVGSGTQVVLTYNASTKSYSGYMSLFLQNLFDNKTNDVQVEYLGLYPTGISNSVNWAVFDADKIKLKVHYISPILSNP